MIFPLNTPFMDSFPMFSPFNPSFLNIFGWFSHRKTGFRLVWTLTAQVVLGPNYDPRVTGEPENGLPVKFSRWAKGSRCNEVCGTVVCMCVHNYTHIYIWSRVPCSHPPNRMGLQVAPPSLLFESYWQHFWGPASYLLGLCSISDYQPHIHTYLPT